MDLPAYAELFGWYLGDGHIVHEKRGVYGEHIFNVTKYVVLNEHVKDLMRRVKPGAGRTRAKVPGCTNTTVSWKHWPCLFPQHGPGRKDQRTLTMTSWQWEIVGRIRRTSSAACSIPTDVAPTTGRRR